MSLFKKTLNVLCPSVRSSKQRSLFGLLSISCGSCISLFSMLPAQAEPAAVFAPYLSQLLEKAPAMTTVWPFPCHSYPLPQIQHLLFQRLRPNALML